jgi:sporulation protein YlmC with PRC-barrel domain
VRDLSGTETDPQETTPLQLGRPVHCSDGRVGRLSDVVIDPRERRVSHLVVEDPHGAARLVPAELLVQGWAASRDVVLSCSSADFSKCATIRSFSYVGLGKFPENDERSDVGVEDLEPLPSFGAAAEFEFGADLFPSYAVTYDRIPPGSAELRRGSIAVSTDEEEVGRVDGFLLAGTRLTHVVLEHTRLPGAAAVPLASVTAIGTDRITLALPSDPTDAFEQVESRWLPLA